MIQDFYFRFYYYIHSERISIFLAYLVQFVYFIRFFVRRLLLKQKSIAMDKAQADEILRRFCPQKTETPDYSMTPQDECCDLSVIVPVYNHADVLQRCIDSIIHQITHYQFELILVDDGSTDGAQKIVEMYAAEPNVRIIHQKNGGIAAARNTGLCHSCGKYIMFVDCDDYIHNDLIDRLMTRAEQGNYDIVMCAHALVKVKNGVATSRLPNIYPDKNLLGYKNDDEIMNYPGLPWGKVYKRYLFEKVRFFPGCWYEDTIIHGLIFTQCRQFAYVPEVEYEYQWYEKNFSHTQNGKGQYKSIDRYWILKAIVERYNELGLEKNEKFYTMLLKHVSAYYYPTIAGLPEEIISAMYVLGRELLLSNKPTRKVKLPFMLRYTEKAILNDNYALWKLCSVSQ